MSNAWFSPEAGVACGDAATLSRGFELCLQMVLDADPEVRRSAAQGVRAAGTDFVMLFTTVTRFAALPKPEQLRYLATLDSIERAAWREDPVTSVGVTLFKTWVAAVILEEGDLVAHFTQHLAALTRFDGAPLQAAPGGPGEDAAVPVVA